MVQYRCFRNDDPPHLVTIWNESLNGRGAARLRHATVLERNVFSKSYFDPKGLIIAEDNGKPIGFAHGGFGSNQRETMLLRSSGVGCIVAVLPAFRRQGIGSELLRRLESYLAENGAKTLYAGAGGSMTPFYFSLYGGSGLPGVLDSDESAIGFLKHQGYKGWETTLVFQRPLESAIEVPDGRFAGIRQHYDARIVPRIPLGTWWQECKMGLIEPVEFRLEEKESNRPVSRAFVWEMEYFSSSWNLPTVGMLEFQVRTELRRKGLGKFLMAQMLRYLQDQYFGLVEIQIAEANEAGCSLCKSVGFEHVDTGRIYRKA